MNRERGVQPRRAIRRRAFVIVVVIALLALFLGVDATIRAQMRGETWVAVFLGILSAFALSLLFFAMLNKPKRGRGGDL